MIVINGSYTMKTFIQSIKLVLKTATVIAVIGTSVAYGMDFSRFIPLQSDKKIQKYLQNNDQKWQEQTKEHIYTHKESSEELKNERLKAEKEWFEQRKKENESVTTCQALIRGYLARKECEKKKFAKFWQNLRKQSGNDDLSETQHIQLMYENIEKEEIEKALTLLEQEKQEKLNETEQGLLDEWITTLKSCGDVTLNCIVANKFITNSFEEHWEIIRTNNKKNPRQPILLISLHGTFANSQEAGVEKTAKTSQAITQYGQWLANTHGNNVDFLTFQWAAANTETCREESGQQLADVIINYIEKHGITNPDNIKLFSVTHSWGGAVMQYAAKKVFEKTGIEFDCGIQTACPVPHVKRTSGEHFHFKKLLQFYSNADLTQILGSNSTWSQFCGRKMPLLIDNDHRVWNIRIIDDGEELNHINIKWKTMEHAPELITAILENYDNQFDLDANILPHKKYHVDSNILVGIRTFGDIPLSEKQASGDTYNKNIFEEIYGYQMKDKSNFFMKILTLCTKTPLYGITQMTIGTDAWIKKNDTIQNELEPGTPDDEKDKNTCIIS